LIIQRHAVIANQKKNCLIKHSNCKPKDDFPCKTQQSQIKRQIALRNAAIINKKDALIVLRHAMIMPSKEMNCPAKCSNRKPKNELPYEKQQLQTKG